MGMKKITTIITSLVVGAIMIYTGLFVVEGVSYATALPNESAFYGTQTALVSFTSVIFSVFGLLLILFALGYAISAVRGTSQHDRWGGGERYE